MWGSRFGVDIRVEHTLDRDSVTLRQVLEPAGISNVIGVVEPSTFCRRYLPSIDSKCSVTFVDPPAGTTPDAGVTSSQRASGSIRTASPLRT